MLVVLSVGLLTLLVGIGSTLSVLISISSVGISSGSSGSPELLKVVVVGEQVADHVVGSLVLSWNGVRSLLGSGGDWVDSSLWVGMGIGISHVHVLGWHGDDLSPDGSSNLWLHGLQVHTSLSSGGGSGISGQNISQLHQVDWLSELQVLHLGPLGWVLSDLHFALNF